MYGTVLDKAYQDIDIKRLSEKVLNDRSALQKFRQNRVDMIRECAGFRYGENYHHVQKTKLNLMSLYQGTVGRNLIDKSPRVYLQTYNPKMRDTVAAMEKWCNLEIYRQRLADTFQQIVIDGFYGPGIAKISLATPGDSAMSAWNQQAGRPLLQRIDFDDWVYDTNSHNMLGGEYYGHRFRVPVRVAKAMYGEKHKFDPMGQPDFNRDGDERIGRLTRSDFGFYELEDHVELWELYLPHHRMVVVISGDCIYQTGRDGREQALWYQKWIGRDSGPCEILSYGTVTGNAMPKAPMMDLYDIHLDYQNVARKGNETMRDLKEMTLYRKMQTDDAKTIQNTPHLGMAGLDDPEAIKTLITGGKTFQLFQGAATWYKENFSFMGANLELLGGRSQQGGTLGQEELLQSNASASIADMQDRTTAFVERCLRSFLWYPWNNPQEVQEVNYDVPGLPDISATSYIYPANHPEPTALRRTGRFEDLEMKIVKYSMQSKTPAQMLAFLNQVIDKMMPMMPMLQQQGVMFDVNFWLEEIAKLGDAPDLAQTFTIQEPPPAEESEGLPHDRIMPTSTTRTNVRKNVSERTQGGTDQQMMAQAFDMDLGGASEA